MTERGRTQPETIELQRQQIELLREENRLLKEKIDYILRQLYGSKSEQLDPSQLQLLLDPEAAKKPNAADCEDAEPAAENIIPITEGKPHKNNRRPRLPENLPTIEQTIIPDEVAAAPQNYRRIGQEISEKLDVEPARYTRPLHPPPHHPPHLHQQTKLRISPTQRPPPFLQAGTDPRASLRHQTHPRHPLQLGRTRSPHPPAALQPHRHRHTDKPTPQHRRPPRRLP